ncbi:hypothetical protein MSG28_004524 [Choristoneura fumiferana]|uniref:Uncharacterized protein n=1 Tax=Choristoneura fumiferana TaxID=7141 RepID=A0ACC0K6W3_CHOFU|nr:hypothetical protein MSG28_004524 [Choristoneura fumiferana]
MEKLGDYIKQSVLNFKLELCCFVASVRAGTLMLACANVALGFIILIALAEGTFEPVLLQALNGLAGDGDPPNFQPVCIVAYAVELGSNALLLCVCENAHSFLLEKSDFLQNDLVLLRVFLYYTFGVITAAVMVYSVVFFAASVGLEILILTSVGYQLYMILLVRSAMVEIKQETIKNGYTVTLKRNDIEVPSGPGPKEKYSVVIEPERIKKAPVTIVKVDTHKPPEVGKELPVKTVDKEATLPVHLATRHEVAKGPVKEITVPIHEPKETKAEAETSKEVAKEKEVIKKPSRSFFGRKEKVKIEESKAKLEKIDEVKKV